MTSKVEEMLTSGKIDDDDDDDEDDDDEIREPRNLNDNHQFHGNEPFGEGMIVQIFPSPPPSLKFPPPILSCIVNFRLYRIAFSGYDVVGDENEHLGPELLERGEEDVEDEDSKDNSVVSKLQFLFLSVIIV